MLRRAWDGFAPHRHRDGQLVCLPSCVGRRWLRCSAAIFLASRKVTRNFFRTALSRLPKFSRRISRPAMMSATRSRCGNAPDRSRGIGGTTPLFLTVRLDIHHVFVGHESDLMDARSSSSGSIGSAVSMATNPQTNPAANRIACAGSITPMSFISTPIYRLSEAQTLSASWKGVSSENSQGAK
jgi:hypothetical protein